MVPKNEAKTPGSREIRPFSNTLARDLRVWPVLPKASRGRRKAIPSASGRVDGKIQKDDDELHAGPSEQTSLVKPRTKWDHKPRPDGDMTFPFIADVQTGNSCVASGSGG